MKKLLGLVIGLCAATVLSVGTTGCSTNKDKDKDKEAKIKEKEKDKDVDKGDKKIELSLLFDGIRVVQDSKLPSGIDDEITLKRGKDATNEVALTVAVHPKGKAVEASVDPKVLAGDKIKASLKVDWGDTAKGDYTITITAKSDGSPDAETKLTVTVPTLFISAKPEAVTVSQGKKEDVKVSVKLGKGVSEAKVTAEVKDATGKSNKDVTVTIAPEKLDKSGEATATITLAEAAAKGDYHITIMADSVDGFPRSVSAKISVKVVEK